MVFLEARHCSAAARGDISEGRCWRRCSSERRRVHVRSGRAASWQQGDDVVNVILGIDDWVAAQVPLVGSGRAATAVQRRGAASPEGGDAGGDARVSGVRCTPPRKGDILGGESSEEGCQERHPGSGASSERVGWKRAGTQDRQGASLWLEQRKGHGPWGARWDGGEAEQGDMAAGVRHWGGRWRWELQQEEGSKRLRDRATTAEAEQCGDGSGKLATPLWGVAAKGLRGEGGNRSEPRQGWLRGAGQVLWQRCWGTAKGCTLLWGGCGGGRREGCAWVWQPGGERGRSSSCEAAQGGKARGNGGSHGSEKGGAVEGAARRWWQRGICTAGGRRELRWAAEGS